MHRLALVLAFVPLVACATAPVARTHVTAHPNGEPKWQVELIDGVPDGPSVTWHENGRIASRGMYRAGKRDGEFDYWDDEGNLVRREVYRDDVLVSRRLEREPAIEAPAMVAARPVAVEDPHEHYTDIRLIAGMGGTSSARRIDAGGSDNGEPVMAATGSVLVRRGRNVFGATSQVASTLWGPEHNFVGAMYGLSTPGDRGTAQLLVEGGLHRITNLGDDLFDVPRGDTSVILPYLGTQLRITFDPGDRGAIIVDLAVTARSDLGSETRNVMVDSCFFGCTSESQTWRAGGQSVDVSLGLGYRF